MSVNEMSIRCLQFLRTHTCIYVLNILFQIIELNITIWIKRAFYFGGNKCELPRRKNYNMHYYSFILNTEI